MRFSEQRPFRQSWATVVHLPQNEIPVKALADAFMVCFEGDFILSKSFNDPLITAEQLRLYRRMVELMFRA